MIVEGDQVSPVRGTINPLSSARHVAQENSPPERKTNIDDLTYQMKHPQSGECEIAYVEEGHESIQEMLNKQINYGNKMKYIDGRANQTNKMKNNSLEQEKMDKIRELVQKGVLVPIYKMNVTSIKKNNQTNCLDQMAKTEAERRWQMLKNAKAMTRKGEKPPKGNKKKKKKGKEGS